MKCVLEVTAADQLLTRLPDALAGEASLAPLAAGQTPPDALLLDEPIDDDIAVVVTTSGSTGTPKGVELSAAALLVSAEATRKALGSFTWTCVLPTSYVAGLMVLVRGWPTASTEGEGSDSHRRTYPIWLRTLTSRTPSPSFRLNWNGRSVTHGWPRPLPATTRC